MATQGKVRGMRSISVRDVESPILSESGEFVTHTCMEQLSRKLDWSENEGLVKQSKLRCNANIRFAHLPPFR